MGDGGKFVVVVPSELNDESSVKKFIRHPIYKNLLT
jgi:hypothetical protein